jgi:N6-L-threonylcarbamoyladenine synthase
MNVLGIESTCDETAVAIVADGARILSNVIVSQIQLHAAYGGVFPEVASRAHSDAMVPALEEALKQAHLTKDQIDLIAVAYAPGLIGGLLIGLETAKGLSLALGIPFVGVNHVEAHLYSAMMEAQIFPSLGVVVSGGHTLIVKMDQIGSYTILGTTIDDALGEAFDKLAVMLGFNYPGGPMIEQLALKGDPCRFKLPTGRVQDKPFHGSYSGLKTACRNLIEKQEFIDDQFKADLAASFQKAVFLDLGKKIQIACDLYDLEHVYLGGGVVCNTAFYQHLTSTYSLKFHFAPKMLASDNAAMIAGLGFHRYKLYGKQVYDLMPKTRTQQF